MSFLTSSPDLSNTIFTDKELQLARGVLQTIIAREDTPWLKKPQGILGEYWKRNDVLSVCFLINIARMIDILESNITDKSHTHLRTKVKQLLRPPSPEQFTEILTEFQVAFSLVQYVSPLKLLVSDDIIEPEVQRAPDFAFQIPEGIALVETTVFHGGILDKWTQSTNYIRKSLQSHLSKQNPPLTVYISLPLKLEIDEKQIVSTVLREIDLKKTNSITIGGKGVIAWEPFIISKDLPSAITEISSFGAYGSPGAIIDRAFASSIQINFPTKEDVVQAQELVLKSLRNKLKEKKDQFPKHDSEPHIIAMRVEHTYLNEGDVATLLANRIWPNKSEYNWLSGLILYKPAQGFLLSQENKAQLELCRNPNATCLVTQSLLDVFNENKTFH